MLGNYDIVLVVLSYVIASLAGFVALEFATRLRARTRGRWPWLLGGALAMGTGVWAMHFVGMSAFSLPVPISFDASITLLSWVLAVVVCAIALYIVGYGRLSGATLAAGALVMGAGVCLMHYSGMWAMRMTPVVTYHKGLFAASVAIAVAASGAALVIIAMLGEVRTRFDFVLRAGAAMLMGLAVVGMHYTGMAAAQFADGAYCDSGNALAAAAMPFPTTVATLLILVFAIAFAVGDARASVAARRAEHEQSVRVALMEKAFVDRETGLPNRARLSQVILEHRHRRSRDGFNIVTFELRPRGATARADGDTLCFLRDRLHTALPAAFLARTAPDRIVALIDGSAERLVAQCAPMLDALARDPAFGPRFVLSSAMRTVPPTATAYRRCCCAPRLRRGSICGSDPRAGRPLPPAVT